MRFKFDTHIRARVTREGDAYTFIMHHDLSHLPKTHQSLQSLGGCQSVISALSSKLLSIGALLVAYELKNQYPGVGIAHVETHGYNVDDKIDREKELENTELASLWLVGDCYE